MEMGIGLDGGGVWLRLEGVGVVWMGTRKALLYVQLGQRSERFHMSGNGEDIADFEQQIWSLFAVDGVIERREAESRDSAERGQSAS